MCTALLVIPELKTPVCLNNWLIILQLVCVQQRLLCCMQRFDALLDAQVQFAVACSLPSTAYLINTHDMCCFAVCNLDDAVCHGCFSCWHPDGLQRPSVPGSSNDSQPCCLGWVLLCCKSARMAVRGNLVGPSIVFLHQSSAKQFPCVFTPLICSECACNVTI